MKRWLRHYALCCVFLHSWGERAWPWNVHFVWNSVAED